MSTSTEKYVEEFYDALAPDYDEMTGFEGRFIREGPFFKRLVESYRIDSAIDAGCGTGFHSLLLARLGVKVTAVDVSEAMLEKVRRHAAMENQPITTVRASFQEVTQRIHDSFDGVFCMGNALAHLLTPEDLRLAFGNFSALLKHGGLLVFQVLNFERILAQRPRILSVKTSGSFVYTRYYDYEDRLIRFNIAKSTGENTPPEEVITTTLRPVLWKEISVMLDDAGYESVKCFGSISMNEYVPSTSQDLLVLASKKLS